MLGSGDVNEKGKEPLLADETVPPEFLPSDTDGRPKSRAALWALGAVVAVVFVGSIAFGVNQDPPEWDPLLAPLVDFVETERGLAFSGVVSVRSTSADGFDDGTTDRFSERIRVLSTAHGDGLRLLGLHYQTPGLANTDFFTLFDELEEGAVSDFEPTLTSGQIVISENIPDALLPLLLVRELTHGLQLQNDLQRNFANLNPQLPARDADRERISFALSEGDAARVERAYFEQLTPAEQEEVIAAQLDGARGLPLTAFTSEEYALAIPLASSIAARDDNETLNELLRTAPLTTTDVFLDPLGNVEPSVDATEAFIGPETVDGKVGAYGWFVALAPLVGTADAFDAVIGYDDDAFALFDNPDVRRTSPLRTCGRFQTFFDTTQDAVEFSEIVEQLNAESEVDEEEQSVTTIVCESLRDFEEQTPAAVIPVIVHNELIAHHLESGESEDVARCAALTQAKTVPHDLTEEDFVGLSPLNAFSSYTDESAPFVEDCR